MKNILIADDHPLILDSVANLITTIFSETEIVKASDWPEVLFYNDSEFDLFILDLEMPGGNAKDVISKINLKQKKSKIILLTMHAHSWVFQNLSQQKIEGFVSKVSDPAEIICAINALTRNETFLCPEFKRVYLNKKRNHQNSIELTRRETEILEAILEAKSTKEIAESLSLSVSTIETHRKNLFLKFGVKNVVGLVIKSFETRIPGN